MKLALTIAASDSGGGAGIQADIKAMQANGVFAASVLVASTAQNTQAVTDIHEFPASHIEEQIDAVMSDFDVSAVKTGMLFSSEIVQLVSRKAEEHEMRPFIVDPVMISKTGHQLLQDEAIETVRDVLLPRATLITPNTNEASRLLGEEIVDLADAKEAARSLHNLGPDAVLVKGGHLKDGEVAVDVLFDGIKVRTFEASRIDTPHTHGTGCTYASAIAANLATGRSLREAIARAKRYVTSAIRSGLAIGQGRGPTHHFYFLDGFAGFPIGDE